MSQLIEALYLPGRNLYVVSHYGGQVWNKDTAAYENYNQGNWTHYAIALTEQTSSGYYYASYPNGIPAGTLSTECLYQQNGATPVLPALPGGDTFLDAFQSQGVNLQNIGGDGGDMLSLKASSGTIIRGSAVTGTLSASQATTTLTTLGVDNALNGRVIIWTSGALQFQASVISALNHTSGLLSWTPAFTGAPSNGDTFVVV